MEPVQKEIHKKKSINSLFFAAMEDGATVDFWHI
jgi:hypothetical protein